MQRLGHTFALAILVALLAAVPASAGGWAVVTLDHLPTQIVAGEPITIGFMVRQHGVTPVDRLNPTINLTRADKADAFSVRAIGRGAVGHYEATVKFPSAGIWEWMIEAYSFPQPMPALTVVEAVPRVKPGSATTVSVPQIVTLVGALGALGALIIWIRTRKRLALALLALAAAIGMVGFAFANNRPAMNAPEVVQKDSANPGRSLFIAKGCIVCHSQSAVNDLRRGFAGLNVGPDLTATKLGSGYLQTWLKNPRTLKPNTEMPNLDLSDAEIDALIAFLQARE